MSISNSEQNFKIEQMEIADLDPSKYRLKNIKFYTIVVTTIGIVIAFIIAMVIALVTVIINLKLTETQWNETFTNLIQKYTRLEVKLEDIENNLQNLEIVDNRTKGMTLITAI